MCQGITSGLSITTAVLSAGLKLEKVSCQAVLSLEVYFLTSSLVWFILDNIDITLMTLNKPVTTWKAFGIAMAVGWGVGLLPVIVVLSTASADLGLGEGGCWFRGQSHWSLAGVLYAATVIELVSLNISMFALLKKRKQEPDLRMLPEKKSRLLTSAATYTTWTIANCIGSLAFSSQSDIIFYIYGALTLVYALIHGGLFVLGEYKVNGRLSVVYRLLKLQPVPADRPSERSLPRPGTSQPSRPNQPSPREVCRVPPLSKEGPKLGAVYRRTESEKQFDMKL
ncbi:uncharacterized protein LOC135469209 isoform X2 [Liolophura sinensis]